ncbi:N-acetyltransferase [Sphingobium amiense]|uniref:Aminoglycoside N(6')-acetyltransferase type 1 n=1 Tax=Sphingobium amiense TaxID=135719 RepID=A0A494VZQ3_9SPHN|nr:aminoglycoside 6'-N-acetyltransferase [Sphingobium amiense]BBD97894.1 N-acetyltransferase [Sphingobium amiense]
MTPSRMRIVEAESSHIERWVLLRASLWPEDGLVEHRDEALAMLRQRDGSVAVFIALDDADTALGFAEASIRRDYVNGCETSPVLFLEGLYVDPAARRQGCARALTQAADAWGRAGGCREMASDADIDNHDSHAFHEALGLRETERVVYFRKPLD